MRTPRSSTNNAASPGAGVQFADIVRHERAGRVIPGPDADTIARVDRLIVVRGVTLDAQIRAPEPLALADGVGEPLTRGVSAGKAAEVAGLRTSGWSRKKSLAARSAPTGRIPRCTRSLPGLRQERTFSQAPPFPRGAREEWIVLAFLLLLNNRERASCNSTAAAY